MPNQFEFIINEDNKLILVKLFSIFKNLAELSYFQNDCSLIEQ
jgi:hypothetical protein